MAHPDLDQLINALIPFAQEQLTKHGGFYPFGAVMEKDGQIALEAVYTGNELPTPEELIRKSIQSGQAAAQEGTIHAWALCADVKVTAPGQSKKRDAISIQLEHLHDEPVQIYVPYTRVSAKTYEYGDLFASPGTPMIFGS